MGGRIQCHGGPGWLCGGGADVGWEVSVDRFGERSSIPAVVDQSVANVVTDTGINGQLATTDIRKLKGHLVDPVCMATGGPCTYSGRDMETIHAGMKISNRHFEVEDLVKALDMFKVAAHEKGELLALRGPMKEDIVEAP
jgi:hemoglobin